MEKLEKNPFLATILVIALVYIWSNFVSNRLEFLIGVAVFVGVAGFANSIYLNRRVSKIQKELYKK